MNDDPQKAVGAAPRKAEVLAKCEACGQLYDRSDAWQVRYHEGPGHKPRQRHNLARVSE